MAESGCLKDGHFQNLQVEGHTITSGTYYNNIVEQSGADAEDLTATVSNLVWYAKTTQAGDITLPQATAQNAGMTIKIIAGADWSLNPFKLGVVNGGDTVLTGYMRLGSNTGPARIGGLVVTPGAKSLNIDSNQDNGTAIGGAVGSTYLFTYLKANLIHVEANGQMASGTPALLPGAATSTGT